MSSVTVTNFKENFEPLKEALKKQTEEGINYSKERVEWWKNNHKQWADNFDLYEKQRNQDAVLNQVTLNTAFSVESTLWDFVIPAALNAIQLGFLIKQYNDQKKIAKRTESLANKQQELGYEILSFYHSQFAPHEVAFGAQIDGYFNNPYKPQYDTSAGRMAIKAKKALSGKRRELLSCASQYCTGALKHQLYKLAREEARSVTAAMNSGVKYEEVRRQRMEDKWVQSRLAIIGIGRGVSVDGIKGYDDALKAFASFNADPGAALGQIFNTLSYTVGEYAHRFGSNHTPAPVVWLEQPTATPKYEPTIAPVSAPAPQNTRRN